ncbi:ABC transporter substrate-binding protein [Rhizobium hainanense]|uniref:Peptide/nickel transport system substrate-binding protein n=1 Tax=Rhizobium hainanense TaxID=52131 RepID=A0A1C3W9P4_9HYPH|nr:ABC transporter substrate-binding protein [Rhizobium hainanense]SCB36538.1 peptide/nickel transport system substrate-binding protein [Rhizobium hainanense]
MNDQKISVTRRNILQATGAFGLAAACSFPQELFAQAAEPKVGGTLRIAVPGSATGSLDPHRTQGFVADIVRFTSLLDGLTEFLPDATVGLVLAESFTPNADATEWTVKLKQGVKTHDGKDFVADDVIFTVERILDKSNPTKGSSLIGFIDPKRIEKIDDHTLVFKLDKPYGLFRDVWANRYLRMVPRNFDPAKPVGTGPFKFVSFTVGQQSSFEANQKYFRGRPFVDKLVLINVEEEVASINALRGGQVDISFTIPYSQARIIKSDPALKILDNPSTMSIPIFMRTDIEPFNDPRVRKAMMLIPNREQMVKVALGGYGIVGNDMNGRTVAPCSASTTAQRTQDIAEAKRLLAEAGKANLTVDLITVRGTAGMVECAQILAEQAKAAGVTINVKIVDMAAFIANYPKWTFGVDFLSDLYMPVATRSLLPNAPFNTAHWNDAEFNALQAKAVASVSESDRCDAIAQMRNIEHERGGNLIWGFANILNGYRNNVHGLVPYSVDSPLYYLRSVWLS